MNDNRIHKVCVACYLILTRKTDILLLKRLGNYDNGKYTLISGHLDEGEDVINAMIRESKEEAGITIDRSDLKFVSVIHRHQIVNYGINECLDYIDFYFTTDRWFGDITNNEPNKHDEIRFFDTNHLPYNMVLHVETAIRDFIKNKKPFYLFGWDN